ncbi:methyl-accepting chemotaxis protein [Thiorhodococcus fuscus]|uniref:Methyl-accepting chemotaxis protein n=1 Tax=Thiorhodococcus fuscus TaxID=527200 RepID=A0ABW4Y3G3_9GAMM
MRTNLPVTQIEHRMEDDRLIVSRTDLNGRITKVNLDFIEISGFTEKELIGAPHNIVRHPDMPSAAFEDLWTTVKSGRPWTGVVKNRCKNGDFYWVEANISPFREQGAVVGYISVRRKPTREQIAEAEALYARLRAGKAAKPLYARLLSRINDIYITRALSGGLVLIALLFILASSVSLLSLRHATERMIQFTEQAQVLDDSKQLKALFDEERAKLDSIARRAQVQAGAYTLFAMLFSALLGIWLVRKISHPLKAFSRHLDVLAEGDYGKPIVAGSRDELGNLLMSLKSVQARLDFDMQETKRVALENFTIRTGLDNVSIPVSLSDELNQVTYLNRAATAFWNQLSGEISRRVPGFSVAGLLGTSLADSFEDEAVASAYREKLTSLRTFEMVLGRRNLRLTAIPMHDASGKYRGRVTQWEDRTLEVMAEGEIAQLVVAASQGDFGTRLELEGKDGFFLQLGEGLNRLLDIMSAGLADVAAVLNAVARGDLTQGIEADYVGTFGQLKDDTNLTVGRLREVVGRIREVSEAIRSAAGEIATGNADLSGRTEEQAASLEETASSMEELNATVKQNVQNADQANVLAQGANDVATKGGDMVQRVVETMGEIQQSSRRIADIISVIDGIAFQTNILALNAAVEAARAGEQGRGFAVVAAEVRALAQRSAQAAKEIKDLIIDSVGKVEDGAKLAGEAGTTMREMVERFSQLVLLVDEITQASREQSSGIGQVTLAVAQMDEVTQQNAALVEEAAAAAESLEDQTSVLVRAVSVFDLGDGSNRSGSASRTPSAVAALSAPRPSAPSVMDDASGRGRAQIGSS